MKRIFLPILVVITAVAAACGIAYQWPPSAVNPDPNHNHADFAVWLNGEKLDFSGDHYMSGSSTDESTHPKEGLRKFLHLHDGNGHVIHRHKPGQTLGEFLGTLPGVSFSADPFPFFRMDGKESVVGLYVNGNFEISGDQYVFEDEDELLITNAKDEEEIRRQILQLTKDACLYSKTCPWRGTPPTEGCVADPTVPCKE